MTTLSKINEWSENNAPKWFWALRLALAIALFQKGILFMQDHTILLRIVSQSTIFVKQGWLINAIPWIHMFGGAFLLLGLFTRLVSLIQIPVLIGAVVLNLQQGNVDAMELSLAVATLLMLILFLIVGGGSYSLDKGLRNPNNIEALYN